MRAKVAAIIIFYLVAYKQTFHFLHLSNSGKHEAIDSLISDRKASTISNSIKSKRKSQLRSLSISDLLYVEFTDIDNMFTALCLYELQQPQLQLPGQIS